MAATYPAPGGIFGTVVALDGTTVVSMGRGSPVSPDGSTSFSPRNLGKRGFGGRLGSNASSGGLITFDSVERPYVGPSTSLCSTSKAFMAKIGPKDGRLASKGLPVRAVTDDRSTHGLGSRGIGVCATSLTSSRGKDGALIERRKAGSRVTPFPSVRRAISVAGRLLFASKGAKANRTGPADGRLCHP